MLPELNLYTVRAKRIAQIRGKVGLYFVAALSFLAGMTDAIGFTTTGDFVSFMSGNTTRLAVSIGADDSSTIFTIAALILMFILGNALGDRRPHRTPAFLAVAFLRRRPALSGHLDADSVPCTCVCRAVHGDINAVVEEVNGLPIGLTYVTVPCSRLDEALDAGC